MKWNPTCPEDRELKWHGEWLCWALLPTHLPNCGGPSAVSVLDSNPPGPWPQSDPNPESIALGSQNASAAVGLVVHTFLQCLASPYTSSLSAIPKLLTPRGVGVAPGVALMLVLYCIILPRSNWLDQRNAPNQSWASRILYPRNSEQQFRNS